MLDRIKAALVDSFAGVIAIGLLVAQGVAQLANIFGNPLNSWFHQQVLLRQTGNSSVFAGNPTPAIPWNLALPPLIEALISFLAAFLLLRWLYFTPAQATIEAEQ